MSNYAANSHEKKATGVDTSGFAKKAWFIYNHLQKNIGKIAQVKKKP